MKRLAKILVLFIFLFAGALNAQQTEKRYLSGTGSDHTVDWEFYCTGGMNANKWTTIAVPSCWELQGFGKYDYGFARDSVRGKEKGMYRYRFDVPPQWKNRKINIVFEGVMTDAEVKVNGQAAGDMHQGAFYVFKYDITSLLKWNDKNVLEVTVAKHSSNESVNAAERRADFWIFGGIFRPVWLEALPIRHIETVAIDATANGQFNAEITTQGDVDRISAQLFDGTSKVGVPVTANVNNGLATTRTRINSPRLWNPESPKLYNAVFTLYSKGKPVHTVTKRIGFRSVEVRRRDGIYVNGVKVKMKGVNRHSFRPETGRTLSKSLSIEDVLLMKEMNMNAVRMSHYPPDDHFLDICDSLGLFVIDELAGWHGNYDTPTGTRLVEAMVRHHQHHPSIVIWANGNEGGHNFELDTVFTRFDLQRRPVIHPWQLFGGIETQHYREYNYGIGNYEYGRDIVMPTEFLHGWFDGGHGAGLEDYWEKMWRNPLSAGGFLWDFADQGIIRKDLNDSIDTDKHRGADGILGPHLEKEGSFYAIKEIWSPVRFEDREITAQFDGFLTIENRFHYTNTSECVFTYELDKSLDYPRKSKTAEQWEGKIASPLLGPGEKGRIKIPLPANWKEYRVLRVFVKHGNALLLTKSFQLSRPSAAAWAKSSGELRTPAPLLSERDSLFVVTANGVEVTIHKRTGLLVKVIGRRGLVPFHNGPVIQEGVNNFSVFTAKRIADTIIILSTFDRNQHYNTLEWTIYPSGRVKMKVRYFPSAYFTSMAGVNFSYPEKRIVGLNYRGDGPYRVWKNRLRGNQFGSWEKEYNNTETGESPWIYPEFKGYYSNFQYGNIKGDDHNITISTDDEGLFLRLFTPAWKTDQWHNYEPLFPSGDISFMQGIPSIGTKTQRNETTGPMGFKNIFYDYEKDPSRALQIELYFDFGSNQILAR